MSRAPIEAEGAAVGSMPLDRRGQKSSPVDGGRKPVRFLHRLVPEQVGPPDCPIMFRWTLLGSSGDGWRLMLHRFPPNADDRDAHDHPCSFATLVLAGGYDDLVPDGTRWECRTPSCPGYGFQTYVYADAYAHADEHDHPIGGYDQLRVGDAMRRGMFRVRRAEHRHRTRAGSGGCWSLVIMAPRRRDWGFWRAGKWFQWREYERRFGFGMRCD